MTRITPASIQSPIATDRATATRRIKTITPRSWWTIRFQNGVTGTFGSSLKPHSTRRSVA